MATTGGKEKSGFLVLAVVILLLTLVGAGTGFALGLLLQSAPEKEEVAAVDQTAGKKPSAEKTADAAEDGGADNPEDESGEPAEEEEIPLASLNVITLPPIVTTLAEPKGTWIRFEGAILAGPETEKTPERLAEEAGEQILSYLRTVRLAEIESPSGLLGFRDDVTETVKTLSNGEVRGVLVHGLVVE